MLCAEYNSLGLGFALLHRASLLVNLNYDGNSMKWMSSMLFGSTARTSPLPALPLSDRWALIFGFWSHGFIQETLTSCKPRIRS